MKKGIIFTKDKTEIDVFFLKPHVPPELDWQLGHQIGDGTKENPIIVDDQTGEALMEDMKDCCDDLYLMEEQDVNENSAGCGAREDQVGCCCPVGPKGHQGTVGVKENEVDTFSAICECLEKFSETNLSLDDEDSRDILSITITRKVNNL
jgi:hypothetical protein